MKDKMSLFDIFQTKDLSITFEGKKKKYEGFCYCPYIYVNGTEVELEFRIPIKDDPDHVLIESYKFASEDMVIYEDRVEITASEKYSYKKPKIAT